ncbi:MAG: Gfo/Idh/MocA family oxidoreductase [Cyclobacteriaceae bacterium]|jgi:predicted dehydrogenase
MPKVHIGFMGAGGIARAHAYALNSLKFYYDSVPDFVFESVTSARKESRSEFALKYNFESAQDISAFTNNSSIDTVFILGPNNVHFDHLEIALSMPHVKNIYLEKPVCSSYEEEKKMHKLLSNLPEEKNILVGFQFIQSAAIREALNFWRTGILGKPIHFDLKYYHGDYLQVSYRLKRKTRLTPAPDGGAMADLGSHGISMLMAFLGNDLKILNALQAGSFDDVPTDSDLFSSITLLDPKTKAVGNMSASRISSGTGDWVNLELFAENGYLKYSSYDPDTFEYYLESDQKCIKQAVGSNYQPVTSFPSGHVPSGWLRAMIHAHYIFLTGDSRGSFLPDLSHGLAVQRIVRETASHLSLFREKINN